MPSLPVFRHAFRICFLLAAIWAAMAIPIWLLTYSGFFNLPDVYGGLNWHAHELIFGYAAMVICGFLFTAIPNWTGRLPVARWPLIGLVSLWVAGRIAMLTAGIVGQLPAAIVDVLFLAVVIATAAREIIAGKNWRNLRVLIIILWLLIANILFHTSILAHYATNVSLRASVAALIALITLIGGRLTPSFTRNWLVKRDALRLPASFGRLDAIAIATSVIALLTWTVAPAGTATAILAILAAISLTWRLLRWQGWKTWREPLLVILHIGYTFVPMGFAFLAVHAVRPDIVPEGAVIHAWTAGAIGTMTLAVMTRASLGHTGHALTATHGTAMIYGAVITAAIFRITASFAQEWHIPLLNISGLAWMLAFLAFSLIYGPILITDSKRKNH
ncbi:MAG: NnrS family protein [Candidatus Angelobacter sp.]